MKKNILKSGFNLIEVTMAIAIVGIGIAGIMALFPPAIEANRAANNQNYIGLVSDSFLGYLESSFLHNFNFVSSSLTSTKPTSDLEPARWDYVKSKLSSETGRKDVTISGFSGLYKTDKTNIFAVESADGTVNALIAMWQSGNNVVDGFSASDTDKVRRVYIEVSWPAAVPYANREKKLFVYDVFKD